MIAENPDRAQYLKLEYGLRKSVEEVLEQSAARYLMRDGEVAEGECRV